MKKIMYLIISLILVSSVFAKCDELPGTGIINSSIRLCSDTFDSQEGITITSDNVELNCGTAVIRGDYQEKIGIKIINRKNVTVTRCNILTYNVGVFIQNSSNVHLYDNALLKNDVGVRLYNSYENLIEKHNDKSLIKPVSAINSKFNTVLLGNKRIDRDFCEVNACNSYKDMDICVNNDFYCSDKCTEESDNDCKKEKGITKPTGEIADEITAIEEIPEVVEDISEESNETSEEKLPSRKILVYLLFYVIGFLIFQFLRYIKRFDIEDV